MPPRISPTALGPEDIVARLRASRTGTPGYQLNRVFLCNYWHFGLLTLEIPHGRLFVTGDNATGKSTALVAAMLTLDGDVRPHRLDTFGSAERHIAAYVLGTRDGAKGSGYEHSSRTSLVATEWAWSGEPDPAHPAYLTLGVTLIGNAGNADPVRTWRFLLLDGKRLDKDIAFLDPDGRLVDARTLRARFGAHGQVHDRVEAYRWQVGQHLFGFRDGRDMDRLMDWLLLLRKPNLTSRLSSFSEVTEFIRQALPPLPVDSTAQVTQTFDHLLVLRQALDERLALADAADRIVQEEQAQRLALARLRAYDVRELGLRRERVAARVRDKRRLAARLERDLTAGQATLEASHREVAGLDAQLRSLEDSADLRTAAAIRARLATAEVEAAQAERTVHRQRALLEDARGRAEAARQAYAATEARWQDRLAERRVALDRLRAPLAPLWPAAAARIVEVVAELDRGLSLELELDDPPSAPTALDAVLEWLRHHAVQLGRLVEGQAHLQHARATLVRAEEQLADGDRGVAEEQVRVAARAHELSVAWQRLGDRIEALAPSDDPNWAGLVAEVRGGDETAYQRASGRLQALLAAQANEQLAVERGYADQLGALRARCDGLGARVKAWAAEPTPGLGPLARRALRCLATAGIEARPLGALIDVAPGVSETQAGQIERALSAAGVLEGLVVRPPAADAAATRLALDDIPGALLRVDTPPHRRQRSTLPLIVDPAVQSDSAWANAAAKVLAALGDLLDASANGDWEHGALRGTVAEGARLGLVGTSHRQARRQHELETLQQEQTVLHSEIERIETLRAESVRRHDELLTLHTDLLHAPDEAGVGAARARLTQAQEALARAQQVRDDGAASVQAQRQALARLTDDLNPDIEHLGLSVDGVLVDPAARLRQAREVEQELLTQRAMLAGLGDLRLALESGQQRQTEANAHLSALADAVAEAQRRQAQVQAQVDALRARRDQGHASEAVLRLDRAREARRIAEETLRAADRQVAVLTSRGEDARLALTEAEASAAEAGPGEDTAAAALASVVFGDPLLPLEEAARHLRQGDAVGAAEALLGGSELNRASIERAYASAHDRFVRVFAERRPLLVELQPFVEGDVVRVRSDNRLLGLSAFRSKLAEEITARQALITTEEEQLFTTFLLDGVAGRIGEALRHADAWIDGVNAVLARIPLVHERYVLEVHPASGLSGPLTRHYALFRTPPAELTAPQRQILLDALRETASEAQRRHEHDSTQFAQELERLLDYRAWLRLEVAVVRANGQRVVLTDRVARTRSGAEQMMAQYVPLFAALSALYDLAAPWAPRLIALDEAFDKASDESSQQMLRFLVSQGFQWLMTSPRLTGQGSAVPVYAEYLMVHERASQRAYGIPFFAEAVVDQSDAA